MPTLRERLADVPQRGRVTWIGVRPAHRAPMVVLDEVTALAGKGLDGDRAAGAPGRGPRE